MNDLEIKLVAFDLDDTLAPSKSPLPAQMAQSLQELLRRTQVCVISGGQWTQFQTQVLDHLEVTPEEASRLHLLPTCGTAYWRFRQDQWHCLYRLDLSADECARAIQCVRECAQELGLWEARPWGEIIENRGSQITFSALGQDAPLAAKYDWDCDGTKKSKLCQAVAARLPDLSVRAGGSTSIDITRIGVDKAFGMRKLMEQTGFAPSQIIFIGDRLDPNGNDYPVLSTGISCKQVANWEETVQVVSALIRQIA